MMKTLTRLLAVALVIFGMHTPKLHAQQPDDQPLKYRLELIYIFESKDIEFIFVVGNSGFKSVASLKRFIAALPPGSTLEWAPGCRRLGNEPLLASDEEMADFRRFCEEKGIKFILVPSG